MSSKFLALIIAMMMVVPGMAYEFKVDGIYYIQTSPQSCAVVKGDTRYSGSITIPSTVNRRKKTLVVNEIREEAFDDCYALTSVTLHDSITIIGRAAFRGSGIQSIAIPTSVTRIDANAFAGSLLRSITMPASPSTLGRGLFAGCKQLTHVTLPEWLSSIGAYMFSDCSRLTAITIPATVTSIEENAFAGCVRLKSVAIPASVTEVYRDAFKDCIALKVLEIETCDQPLYIKCGWRSPSEFAIAPGCTSLETLIIGRPLADAPSDDHPGPISPTIFTDAPSLKSIIINTSTPPTTNIEFPDDTYVNCTLQVPAIAIPTYQATTPWNQFTTITPIH